MNDIILKHKIEDMLTRLANPFQELGNMILGFPLSKKNIDEIIFKSYVLFDQIIKDFCYRYNIECKYKIGLKIDDSQTAIIYFYDCSDGLKEILEDNRYAQTRRY